MQTIHPVKTENASATTRRLLDAANDERGVVSNMIKTLAQSPGALEGFVQFRKALSGSALSPEIREQIALAVAQTNLCEYSLAEHAYLATQLGLKKEQILASREARAMDKSVDAVLRFARDLAARKGECSVVECATVAGATRTLSKSLPMSRSTSSRITSTMWRERILTSPGWNVP
jgi:AhpD family alkylhydroperoxidase